MLQSVLAMPPAGGGGPGSDTTAARLVDPRFRGIQRIDLRATYNARCDGSSHPLGGIYSSLAAATVAYPNAGLTSANWAAMEIDTAAFLQAEYDIPHRVGRCRHHRIDRWRDDDGVPSSSTSRTPRASGFTVAAT